MPPRLSRLLVFVLSALLGGPAVYGFYRWEVGNFHVVSPEQVYRSRQLDGLELASVARRYGIKSILNLRGRNQGDRWYRDEAATSERFGMRLFDYPISAHRELTSAQAADIIQILREAPKPLLIHCKSGADRTSLVSALYLYDIEEAPAVEAARQLSLYYGHLPAVLGADSRAMDLTFWRMVGSWSGHDVRRVADRRLERGPH